MISRAKAIYYSCLENINKPRRENRIEFFILHLQNSVVSSTTITVCMVRAGNLEMLQSLATQSIPVVLA